MTKIEKHKDRYLFYYKVVIIIGICFFLEALLFLKMIVIIITQEKGEREESNQLGRRIFLFFLLFGFELMVTGGLSDWIWRP